MTDPVEQDENHKRRVLVVEDEFLIALDISEHLKDAGYEIIGPADCVDDAIRLIGEYEIDIALLDINLGDSRSYDVAELLMSKNIPFTFISGYAPLQLRADFSDKPVLSKPFESKALISSVESLSPAP